MRARTRSVASMHEYFEEEDDTRSSGASSGRSSSFSYRMSMGGLDDWDFSETRVRRCSHSKRISFDDDVKVETIPSLSSIDEATKKNLWYSADDFAKMQQQQRAGDALG
ncbi:hypothetical protein H310_14327 [Aphanomyces invadans]|uniref:Uncharacterized protein n=1 Tax=Aphanomyces invadans TaxID=157072 RepID=A0A024TCE3_9STRA|nr:hypothetical protein H310_14327 [Aphanomyces invadans]ETV90992.1 hypothetical protein H310_14327 [Aphanomyces invadans]RHY34641.1 hypothetical protein DYB32_000791 [Aphanomyces invadans]|eukprot:XP_008880381.1 hypothetical protein H310_14327 [Aphanomyces invadans]